jgi:hypothetical protein
MKKSEEENGKEEKGKEEKGNHGGTEDLPRRSRREEGDLPEGWAKRELGSVVELATGKLDGIPPIS